MVAEDTVSLGLAAHAAEGSTQPLLPDQTQACTSAPCTAPHGGLCPLGWKTQPSHFH